MRTSPIRLLSEHCSFFKKSFVHFISTTSSHYVNATWNRQVFVTHPNDKPLVLPPFPSFPSILSQRTLSNQQRSKHSPYNRSSSEIDVSRIVATLGLVQIREWSVGRGLADPICDLGDEQTLSRGRGDGSDEDFPVEFCVGVADVYGD